MKVIRLNIKGISYSQTQTGAYALILEEESETEKRKIPIIIGSYEAQSIALALEKDIVTPRPITHELFVEFIKKFNINIQAICIYKLIDGIFYSNILFEDLNGDNCELDSRTSDAIALAVRLSIPIYTTEEVLDKAGIIMDMNDEEYKKNPEEEELEKKKVDDNDEDEDDEYEMDIESILETKEYDYTNLSDNEINEMIEDSLKKEDYETAAILRDEIERRKK